MRYLILWLLATASVAAAACSSNADDTELSVTAVPMTDTAEAGRAIVISDGSSQGRGAGEAWLGVSTVPVPEVLAGFIGVPAGERVAWVTSGSPADGSVLLGDTMTAIDGAPLEPGMGLAAELQSRNPGDTVTVSLTRGETRFDVPITLGVAPAHDFAHDFEGLAGIQELFDRALSAELTFLDSGGQERTVSLSSGTLSGVTDDRVTIARAGAGPETTEMSPNVFLWIDGAPGTASDLDGVIGESAKVLSVDSIAVAVVAGRVVPAALEAFVGADSDGLLELFGGLDGLEGFLPDTLGEPADAVR